MSDLEIDRAKAQSKAGRVLSASKIAAAITGPGKPPPPVDRIIARALKDLGVTAVEVPANFPLAVADALRKQGIRLSPTPEPFFPSRVRKAPAEIAKVAEAQKKTEHAMRAAALAIRNSTVKKGHLWLDGKVLTAERVKTIINLALMQNNVVGAHTIVACCDDAVDPHNEGSGPLCAQRAIIIDIFPRDMDSMYYGDMTRTFIVGEPSAALRRQYKAVLEAQLGALGMMKAGVTFEAVHEGIKAVFARYGYETGPKDGRMQGFFHSTGHGIGLDIHEPPRIASIPGKLEEGMVVSVEPGLYYAGVGGVRIEDLVVIKKGGIVNLNRYPKTWKP
jgi:Xaa-Pro aminopeptidase